jgi:hypothetical protein
VAIQYPSIPWNFPFVRAPSSIIKKNIPLVFSYTKGDKLFLGLKIIAWV